MKNDIIPGVSANEYHEVFSKSYCDLWNDDIQQQIDRDIDANRKSDSVFKLPDSAIGREVSVEQISHSFIFGAHIFNFDQLGTDERNRRYKELFGTLFNSATVAFYWKTLEPVEGYPRFSAEYRDSAEFWNNCAEPWKEPHWRRPATDPVIKFCLDKKIRIHGHPLVWGNNSWNYPDWLINKLPLEYLRKADLDPDPRNGKLPSHGLSTPFKDMSLEEFLAAIPEELAVQLNATIAKRIMEIAVRYGDKVHSWDVVNESAIDCESNAMIPGAKVCNSIYGPMPGDYTYRGFKIAESVLPADAKLNINDYKTGDVYANQIKDLLKRNCKIDIAGIQMHLFNPQDCQDIADGVKDIRNPQELKETVNRIAGPGLPIHMSEITVSASREDRKGEIIQAGITRNLYRMWFSMKPVMGITWWNVVDNCGAPGEPSLSGIFTRDMEPKLAFHTLNDLINREWKTKLSLKPEKDGTISFRGFRGSYKFSWVNADGQQESVTAELK